MPAPHCPVPGANCADLKHGAALLTLCVYAVSWSRILLGGDFSVLVNAAFNLNLSPGPVLLLAGWVFLLLIGGDAAWAGWRSTRTHVDPLNRAALTLAVAAGLIFLYGIAAQWHVPVDWFGLWRMTGIWVAVASRGLLFAALAYNLAGVWLQIRGPVAHLLEAPPAPLPLWPEPPRWQPPPPQWQEPPSPLWDVPPQNPPPVDVARYEEVIAAVARKADEDAHALAATWGQAVAERDAVIATLADDLMHAQATRDRYQTNGKRIAAEKRELEALARDLTAVLQFPDMRKAMLAAQHPDRGKTEAEKRAHTVRFQKVGDVFDRIETKGRAR
jgi:hypothetical protein